MHTVFRNLKHNGFFRAVILLICWSGFLIFGIYSAAQVRYINSSLMRALINSRMTIVSLACVVFLPFFCSVVAFRLRWRLLLFLVVCIKAFAFGYSCCLVYLTFGNAGWLMRWLLVFTDSISVVPLLCYWCENTLNPRSFTLRRGGLGILVMLILACTSYFCLIPIYSSLF